MAHDPHAIGTLNELLALVGTPGEASLRKEAATLSPAYRAMIEASPFALLATHGAHGLDISPRGDPPGFIVVEDERTLLLPERRGNHRVDSLRNLLHDPRVALLFLIPGVGETLRVRGTARITVDPALLERCSMHGRAPTCVLVIGIESVYFQCARAILRSNLWDATDPASERPVPTAGQMLAELTEGAAGGAAYDRGLVERQRESLH
jgi:PPOX class probable FMN-dependent enzyme